MTEGLLHMTEGHVVHIIGGGLAGSERRGSWRARALR